MDFKKMEEYSYARSLLNRKPRLPKKNAAFDQIMMFTAFGLFVGTLAE
jgi:hypothetical protein